MLTSSLYLILCLCSFILGYLQWFLYLYSLESFLLSFRSLWTSWFHLVRFLLSILYFVCLKMVYFALVPSNIIQCHLSHCFYFAFLPFFLCWKNLLFLFSFLFDRTISVYFFCVWYFMCISSALHFKDLLVTLCLVEFFMPLDFCLPFLHVWSELLHVWLCFHYWIFNRNCSQIVLMSTAVFCCLFLIDIGNINNEGMKLCYLKLLLGSTSSPFNGFFFFFLFRSHNSLCYQRNYCKIFLS